MRVHRFYMGSEQPLTESFWLHDKAILHQWRKVLRLKAGDQVLLFDGVAADRLYKLVELNDQEAQVQLITEFARQIPKKEVYLLWALLKKDKNDWVLQKATELGVSHFLPLLAERSEKTGFNLLRAQKIMIEAAEQCGRSDIPAVREPMRVQTAINELSGHVPLYVCQQEGEEQLGDVDQAGILIGPEGGWSEAEKRLFKEQGLKHLNLHDFTLRAETAALAAVTKLVQ
jgi:16S rRNA (uracil1498-N3)-methyltransferase